MVRFFLHLDGFHIVTEVVEHELINPSLQSQPRKVLYVTSAIKVDLNYML